MALKTHWADFGPEQAYRGYVAHPAAGGPAPALLVIQEAWGVDAHIEDAARRFADAGYSVLAPDLFTVNYKRPEHLQAERLEEVKLFINTLGATPRDEALAKLPKDQSARISDTLGKLFAGSTESRDQHLAILKAAAAWLRQQPSAQGQKLGSVGFCMGGGLSGILAATEGVNLSAAIIFYGSAVPDALIPKVGCKILALHGQSDTRLVEPLPAFEKAMQAAGKDLEVHVYPGAGHAFFNDTRPSFNAHASRDAFARSLSFLNQALA
jgi:carboxymethylenebutenolidase